MAASLKSLPRLAALFLCGFLPTMGGAMAWNELVDDLPDASELEAWAPPQGSVITDRHGVPMGEYYEERRYVLAPDQVPALVQDAFIAAEDARFREHAGIDPRGIARAVLANARERRHAQGASTISQQVVRTLLLENREKTWSRKGREAVLAMRLEKTYDKDEILAFYLNSVFLGAQSYGVEAAARTYFGKSAAQLDLAEAALLAGLPQRPSVYSPFANPDMAKTRRSYVLDQMVAAGMIDRATADRADAEALDLAERGNPLATVAPHYSEQVRRLLVERFGEEAVISGGLVVRTACDLELQRLAVEAVREQAEATDRNSGWRRHPERQLLDDDAIVSWRSEQEVALGGSVDTPSLLPTDTPIDAVVLEVGAERMKVGVGQHILLVRIEDSGWVFLRGRGGAFSASVDQDGDWQRDGPLFVRGDRIMVEVDEERTAEDRRGNSFRVATLWQPVELEGALLSMELATGAVRAMVGGTDFGDSQFNRATQARRQVGSTFKPFVYAAGLDAGRLTPATMVDDIEFEEPVTRGQSWSPKNYGGDYAGPITVTKALVDSRNVALVRALQRIDPGMNRDVVHDFARRLGLGGAPSGSLPEGAEVSPTTDYLCPWVPETPTSKICMDHFPPRTDVEVSDADHRDGLDEDDDHMCRACDYSVGLGSTSLTLEEMVRGYTPFAAAGALIEPVYIEEVRNRDGDLIWAPEPAEPAQVMDPTVAGVMRHMLESVVERGTGSRARALDVPAAGKTGTSDEAKDTWFIGFTPDVITGVWIGYDMPRSVGPRATGGRHALPVWVTYMKAAAAPDTRFPDVPGTHMVSIEELTGMRVIDGNWGRNYRFAAGTIPRAISTEPYVPPPEVDEESLAATAPGAATGEAGASAAPPAPN